ncbi:MAG TPA: ATP synthase F1 subunit gamma, partial [Rhodothermales bacterium]|nr:ATP synthase F1 subunit gamma [Rhodothermales bacterium]
LNLQGFVDPSAHPLFAKRPVQKALVIVVTGDRGLAGPFNTNAIKTAEQALRERYGALGRENVTMIAVGRKGHEYFAKRGYTLTGDFRGVFDRLNVKTADTVGDLAVAGFKDGRWDEVVLVYNEFKNTISQNRIIEPLLPIPAERFLTPVMESAEAGAPETKPRKGQADYLFEPGPEAILEALVPQFLTYQIWRALLESNAAEQGARMVAMDNATTNAEELLKTLKLQYNQARQATITKELIEIVSGANALAG